jgi:RNA polymerase sigma-70 factor (ECF subfamily)
MTDPLHAITAWLERRDEKAARWIVEHHRPMVRRVVAGWVKQQDRIDDLEQLTFIKAFHAMPRLVPGSRFDAWICSIARNTCSNALRAMKRQIVFSLTDCGIEDYTDMMVTYDELPGDENKPAKHEIEHLLARLRPKDRRLLTLVHLEGRSTQEAGQCLGISEGNVRVRLVRSHRTLREDARRLVEARQL